MHVRAPMHAKLKRFSWYAVDTTNLFRLGSTNSIKKIQLLNVFFFDGGQKNPQKNEPIQKKVFFYSNFFSIYLTLKKKFLTFYLIKKNEMKSVQIYIKDAKCADFYFSSYGHFCTENMVNFR